MGRQMLPRKCKIPLNSDRSTLFTECESTRKVLDIDHLREMILDYIIHDGDRVAIANVKNCRLVSKTWCRSTSRVFLKCREPLFNFFMKEDLLEEKREPFKGTLLYQFVESLPKMLLIDERIPPHSIQGSRNFFHRHNYSFFLSCFQTCGSSLVRLELEATIYRYPKPLNKNIVFSKLQTFRMDVNRAIEDEDGDKVISMEDKINYIQSIFNSSEQLKSFMLNWRLFNRVPDNFKGLNFPTTLTELVLYCVLSPNNLEALANSPLSNLKKLELNISPIPLENEILTKILENVRKTLQSFSIRECREPQSSYHADVHRTTFQLPLMEKMEKLMIVTQYPQFRNDSLGRFVPQLNDLTLEGQSILAFRKYTDTSCFPSVTSLKISLRPHIPNDLSHINLDMHDMQSLKTAFPNLQKLDITMYDLDTTPLVFIMKEMRNLKHLHLDFEPSSWEPHFAQVAGYWDALLIGVSVQSVAALKKSPGLWRNLKNQSTVSIRNLTELHTLEITCRMPRELLFEISSAAFRFALFKMPNLSNLNFLGYVPVPKNMIKEWRKRGRTALNAENSYEQPN